MILRPRGARRPLFNRPDDDHINVEPGTFQSYDGCELFYCVESPKKAAKATPMLFCYGLVCSSLHWTYQIEFFRKSRTTIWMDYRGHQNSTMPADLATISLPGFAKDLLALLDHLEIPKVIVLGHSMGVNVALELARIAPDRIECLVLSSGTPTRPLETLLHSNVFEPALKFLEKMSNFTPKLLSFFWKSQKSNPLVHQVIGHLGFNRRMTPKGDIALYVDQLAELDPRIFIRLFQSYDDYDGSTWLHTLKAPTLILAGDHDLVIPFSQQKLLHQLIPNSTFKAIARGSHCPQMDFPDLVNAEISAFLSHQLKTPSRENRAAQP